MVAGPWPGVCCEDPRRSVPPRCWGCQLKILNQTPATGRIAAFTAGRVSCARLLKVLKLILLLSMLSFGSGWFAG